MSSQAKSRGDGKSSDRVFSESLRLVATTVTNPLFLFGIGFGGVVGWGLCWAVFVLPFHKNLADREAQLEKWSRLNLQLQELAAENRELSQAELKQYVAANQEATTSFMEVQRSLHERELRLIQTPTSFVLVPIAVLAVACFGVVFFFKALNQRALATVDHVMDLAPSEMIQEVVRRHVLIEAPSSRRMLATHDGPETA